MQIRYPFFLSIAAGILIGIGGSVFLACESRYVGAVLFSVALLSICYQGLYLFTGKIGYIARQHDRQSVIAVLVTLCGNFLGTLASGLAVGSLAGIILNAVLPVDDDKPTNPLEGPTKAVREQMDELGTPVSADDPATELVNAERKAKEEQLGS